MDALSDIVELLRPQTILLGEMVAAGSWGVRMAPQPGPVFYLVMEGRCWFVPAEETPIALHQGDYMLSLRPGGDVFVSEMGAEVALSDAAYKEQHKLDGALRVGDPAATPVTRKLGGLIMLDQANADLLIDLLPPIIIVRANDEGSTRLHALLTLIRQEVDGTRPGREAILSRLIEILLVETLRGEGRATLPGVGLLGGLADRQLAEALAHIHADIGRNWTVAELARRVGMSRSVFARKFSRAVGVSPVAYLLGWRMALAKDALLQRRGTLEEIARTVGYQSASAFSMAFSQRVGCPPSEYAGRLGNGRSRT